MGYLNKATIVVDAILTNRGRELLAKGGVGSDEGFRITKFALADDEVDYGLYNVSHPQGSDYYGAIIENMPITEATPDEQQTMRYKLVSLNHEDFGETFLTQDGEVLIPKITNASDVLLTANDPDDERTFATSPSYSESYTLLVANARLMRITNKTTGVLLNASNKINANGSITISLPVGATVVFTRIEGKTGETTATVFGDETGAIQTFNITVS